MNPRGPNEPLEPVEPSAPDPASLGDTGLSDDNPEEEFAELGIGARIAPPPGAFDAGSDWSEPAETTFDLEPTPERVEEQIRVLEARLDGLMRQAGVAEARPGAQTSPETESIPRRAVAPPDTPTAAARELYASEYYARQWGRLGMRSRSEDVDEFGLDPLFEERLRPLIDFLYRRYFRVVTEGIEQVPKRGRCIVVANHSGILPLDGLVLRAAMRLDHPAERELRWLAEDFIFYLPFVGTVMNRVGAVRACQENAERLLSKDAAIAAFPEGVQGIRKLYREKYQLQRFGRGGFIRLSLRTGAPIVPCAIVGAEESAPVLYRFDAAARLVGLPHLPITPTFPWLGPLGLVPAPTRWRIVFGEPLKLDGYGPEAADDHVLVGRLSERVRGAIQQLLDRALRRRRSVWFG